MVMAVLVIALLYTSTISWLNLAVGALFLILLVAANVVGIRYPLVSALLGSGGLWLAYLLPGVHATIAGVLAAMTVPARTSVSGSGFVAWEQALLKRFEEVASADRPPLANAGITLDANGWTHLTHPVSLGIMAGLFAGKPVGILLATWAALRVGLVTMPEGGTWRQLAGIGVPAGIGSTMSLFIAGLAFPPGPLQLSANVGTLRASTVAGMVGWVWLRGGGRTAG